MKYPIGIQTFEQIREDGYVYVDKTALLHGLVKSGKIFFLSRPRRFGKSLLLSTLKSYFAGRKELFDGLAMAELETEWNKYPIFHLDFNGQNFKTPGELAKTLEGFIAEGEAVYGTTGVDDTMGNRFRAVLRKASAQYGRKAVVLVDEYDKPLLDVMNTPLEQTNRDILKGFYSVFKLCDEHLRFVMLTGVTKFSQISVFSGFNQPDDISLDPRYEALCGITQAELDGYFTERMQEMATEAGVSLGKMRGDMKRMYDGYHFSERMTDIYNPFSLLNALSKGTLDSFWFRTATPTYLVQLMEDGNERIDEMIGRYYSTSQFIDYKADKQLPLPMIYQSGYLTIKKHNPRTRAFKLDFPNDEVKGGFVALLASSYFKAKGDSQSWIFDAVDALDEGDLERFRKLLTAFLASIPYSQRRRGTAQEQERDFQYTFYLILRMISSYLVFVEKETSEGRADCVIETDTHVYIFEFKRDGSAAEALAQIEAKGYAREYAADSRKVYRIGCNFSTTTGTVSDWAVREE